MSANKNNKNCTCKCYAKNCVVDHFAPPRKGHRDRVGAQKNARANEKGGRHGKKFESASPEYESQTQEMYNKTIDEVLEYINAPH